MAFLLDLVQRFVWSIVNVLVGKVLSWVTIIVCISRINVFIRFLILFAV